MTVIRDHQDLHRGLEELARLDPRLRAIIAVASPVPLRTSEPGFAGLAAIVVSQMISRASATAIWKRMTAGGPLTASSYAQLDPALLATFGLSRAKAATLANLSAAIREGRLDLDVVGGLGTSEAIRQMTSLPGIGPWTAEVYLMFCAGHGDIFPAGDVALQAAVAHAFDLQSRPRAKELSRMADAWSPVRSVAARLFWAYYAARMRRDGAPLA